MKEVKANMVKKKGKEKEKIQRKEEILEEMERERLKISNDIVKNLKSTEVRRQELFVYTIRFKIQKTTQDYYETRSNKFRETCKINFENKKAIQVDQVNFAF